jgi:hypothetical protein
MPPYTSSSSSTSTSYAAYILRPPYIAYGVIGFLVFVAVITALYLTLTGQGELFNVGAYLLSTSPYMWALYGIAIAISFSVGGAAWYIAISLRSMVLDSLMNIIIPMYIHPHLITDHITVMKGHFSDRL